MTQTFFHIPRACLAATTIFIVACSFTATAAAATKPNVVVIVADDLGYADLSFLPQSPADVSTPAIDRLAKLGTYFTDAYATAPICSPSRAGLITGRYQQRWGNFWYGQGGFPKTEQTIAHALKKQGYFTQKLGKTHLNGGEAQHPLDHGFDEYLGFIHHTWDYIRLSQKDLDAYRKRTGGKGLGILNVGPLQRNRGEKASYDDGFTTEIFTAEAVKTIRGKSAAKTPFFIQLEYNAVHMPTYVAHPEYAKKAGYEQPKWDREAERWEFPFWEPKEMSWGEWHKKWGHLGEVDPLGRKRYLANLMALDDGIAKLLSALEETDQLNNTILVFLSDNGGTINTYSNNAPLRGYKYMFGEGGIRVPMIVSWPGHLPGGKSNSTLSSAMDIFPTLLELVGAERPDNLDGKSLVPWLKGRGDGDVHDHLCWSNGRGTSVVRKGPWKLITSKGWVHSNYQLDEQGIAKPAADYEYPSGTLLFNLAEDIGETTDLAKKHPETVKELTGLYDKWRPQMRTRRGKKADKKSKAKTLPAPKEESACANLILVRPLILCDDDGSNPARHALPKELVDRVYTRADLEFLYLDPVRWNHGKARRGEINLNTIVKDGHANGMIMTDPRVATLLFVSAVDGKTQPLGRGLQGGNICFVNLGAPDKMTDPAQRAFVVAHEVGHCFGLIHAVDDPKVPNDVPNLQGDGPYDERLAIEGLHPSQAKTVRASPLALPHLYFHKATETGELIASDHWDNPLDTLGADNMRFELGLTPTSPVPDKPAARLAFARPKYRALADDFTVEETQLLRELVDRLDELIAGRWPVITRVPWHFAKMKPNFCRAMPHTRGLTIVLTESALKRFRKDEDMALEILLHEKLHVIQRLMPGRFELAFKRYGYESVQLPPDSASRFNLVRNPDAPDARWAIRLGDDLLLLATSLQTIEGKFKFTEKIYPLRPSPYTAFSYRLGEPLEDSSILDEWRARFPIRVGHDDPREVVAYLLGQIFRADLLEKPDATLSRAQRALLDQERMHLPELLSLTAE